MLLKKCLLLLSANSWYLLRKCSRGNANSTLLQPPPNSSHLFSEEWREQTLCFSTSRQASWETESSMPRVHKKFYCVADPRTLKIQAFKQPHSLYGLDNYNVIDPRSEVSTNSSMNSHSPQKQSSRMTSGSAETDPFLHFKILTRGQWILHLRPCSNYVLTRALMRSGELRVLMRGWPKGPPSVSSTVRVVE